MLPWQHGPPRPSLVRTGNARGLTLMTIRCNLTPGAQDQLWIPKVSDEGHAESVWKVNLEPGTWLVPDPRPALDTNYLISPSTSRELSVTGLPGQERKVGLC